MMPRFCALLLLAGIAAAALPRLRPLMRLVRPLTPGEMALLLLVSPSPSVH